MKSLVFAVALAVSVSAAGQSAAIATDPPRDAANPAKMDPFSVPSHGSLMNAVAYVASGAGPHPVVILCHGFPGNGKNDDVAQAVRRAGFDVVQFSYRGAWGSAGTFSFSHALEDTQAVVDYVRDPANAKRLRADPAKIVMMGHSMGGWMALSTTAADAKIVAVITISGADMPGRAVQAGAVLGKDGAIKLGASMMTPRVLAPLAGATVESLGSELFDNGAKWSFSNYAKGLGLRPVFLTTADDGSGPAAAALAAQLKAAGNKDVHETHIATDHEYSDKRIALTQAVLDDLATLKLQ